MPPRELGASTPLFIEFPRIGAPNPAVETLRNGIAVDGGILSNRDDIGGVSSLLNPGFDAFVRCPSGGVDIRSEENRDGGGLSSEGGRNVDTKRVTSRVE